MTTDELKLIELKKDPQPFVRRSGSKEGGLEMSIAAIVRCVLINCQSAGNKLKLLDVLARAAMKVSQLQCFI
ncbi:hypothetical protein AB6A40_000281 [Gnathostoma spinigerum]|uniref:Uncharacterized protein n=1 Tax=Gnathostoma spinigerum TaxID=75299 RepID=A0ABD6E3W2_9BILA